MYTKGKLSMLFKSTPERTLTSANFIFGVGTIPGGVRTQNVSLSYEKGHAYRKRNWSQSLILGDFTAQQIGEEQGNLNKMDEDVIYASLCS
jgi:hypothetical protein